MNGKMNYLQELLKMLIDKADDAVPGDDGTAKENWVADKAETYIEANDAEFVNALLKFTRISLPESLVKKIVDNDVTDAAQKMVVRMVIKTAIRLVYANKYVSEAVNRNEQLSDDDKAALDKVRSELDKPAAKTTSKKAADDK